MGQLDELWVLIVAFIVLDLQVGFLALEAGVVRAKNAANVALKNLSDVCVVGIGFWLVGFGLMFGPSIEGWYGFEPFAIELTSKDYALGFAALFIFQMAFASTAATIVSGAVAERERYVGYITLSIALGAFIYPIVGHWVWASAVLNGSKGWLEHIGFVDFAGATVVHSVGGWAAFIAVLVLGPRLGCFSGRQRRFENSSIALVALGGVFLWMGWCGLNGGSAMLFDENMAPIIALTILTAAAGGATAIALSLLIYKYLRAEMLINGILAGLVAGTAGIHFFGSAGALIVGGISALVMFVMRDAFEALRIDDVVGAVPAHLGVGIWGTFAVAIFVDLDVLPAATRMEQLAIQASGVVAVGLWVVLSFGSIAFILKRTGLLRAKPRDGVVGLNIAELYQHSAFLELLEEMKSHQNPGALAIESASNVRRKLASSPTATIACSILSRPRSSSAWSDVPRARNSHDG